MSRPSCTGSRRSGGRAWQYGQSRCSIGRSDAAVRNAAFDWLRAQVDHHGDVLPRTLLAAGFTLNGVRIPLLGPQGIFKPKVLSAAPLSITTAPDGPYDDAFGPNDLLRYRYRGTDPDHPDNQRVRVAMRERLPLIYFHGVVPGKYLAGMAGVRRRRRPARPDLHRRGGRCTAHLVGDPGRQDRGARRPRQRPTAVRDGRGPAAPPSARVSGARPRCLPAPVRVLQVPAR